MYVWVLVRHAYQGDEVLGSYRDRPDVFEAVALGHPTLTPERWTIVSHSEFRLADPRVDVAAGYNLIRTEVL
jgi:hypothetical protein